MSKPILDVLNLATEFRLNQGVVHAVNDVSFSISEGEVLGIVGESGCGKSVTALSMMRLVRPPGFITHGRVILHEDGKQRDLLSISDSELERVRGNKISMIFQDPMTSLNPVLTVGFQIMEPLKKHRGMGEKEAREHAVALFNQVGISQPKLRLKDYPHQFSGGMRQRVMIAMAAACKPKLLIADEPTTALDVTIQAQILDLIQDLKDEIGTSVMIITHDLGVIAEMANYVAVMYAGRIVEYGPVDEIFEKPRHPYTTALMYSIPQLYALPDRLTTIEGAPPSLIGDLPAGCPFEPRCHHRLPRCADADPELEEVSPQHQVACWAVQQGGI
jgi:oligopeptide/dipeptide ABC transporter ATP-binding protein